jgi:polyamine oxidase
VTGGWYTDGRDDIPGELTGPVERVVVVGAGIAGLTVANALAHAGTDCVVLEARQRVGGRLHTVDVAGVPVDLGGSWIHHPVGNPISAFAAREGIGCRDADPLPGLAGYDRSERRWLTAAEVARHLRLLYEEFPDAIDGLRSRLGPDASVAEAMADHIAGSGMAAAEARRARQGLRAVLEGEYADAPERQSLRWLWNEAEYEGGFFGNIPAGGYRDVCRAMAADVAVRFGVTVNHVSSSERGVVVRAADGSIERGSHAVVTVPLGVLKRGAPRFSPPLPPDRIQAIERLGFGRLEKIVLGFDAPFWRASGLSHTMLFPDDATEPTVWVFDHDSFGAGPALVAFVFHSSTGRLREAAGEPPAEWILRMLGEATGRPWPAPSAVAITSWGDDPFSAGAYTHIPPGAEPGDADRLGRPVGGRLLFAGEHTQSARLGYADGALTSGIREAKRLLGRSAVRLGRAAAGAPGV